MIAGLVKRGQNIDGLVVKHDKTASVLPAFIGDALDAVLVQEPRCGHIGIAATLVEQSVGNQLVNPGPGIFIHTTDEK